MKKKFYCGIHRSRDIFLIFKLKYLCEKNFKQMILTHESGSEEDQFDGEKRRPKISWYYPFKVNGSLELEILHLVFSYG
jgi:hypothetical protein